MIYDGITGLLTNVAKQLETVQESIHSCHDTSVTVDSGIDTVGRLEQADNDLELLIDEIKQLSESVAIKDSTIHPSTNSIMENISLALSSLEINKDGKMSHNSNQSEDDGLERMVDELFRNVRSLKSILVEPVITDNTSQPRSSDDNSDQLSKLMELMSTSLSDRKELHPLAHDPAQNYRTNKGWNIPEEERNTREEEQEDTTNSYTEDYSNEEFTDECRECDNEDEYEDDTDMTETSSESTSSISHDTTSSLEYGFIPLNRTVIGTFSQCNTSSGDAFTDTEQLIAITQGDDTSSEDDSSDDSLIQDDPRDYRKLGRLPEFPAPLQRKSSKEIQNMYDKIKSDMSSLSKMVEPDFSESVSNSRSVVIPDVSTESNSSFKAPHLITASLQPTSSNNSDGILSEIKNKTANIGKMMVDYDKIAAELMKAIPRKRISSIPTERTQSLSDIDNEFLDVLQSVKRANKHIDSLKNKPSKAISPEAEWDSFTPRLNSTPEVNKPPPCPIIVVDEETSSCSSSSYSHLSINKLGVPEIQWSMHSMHTIPSEDFSDTPDDLNVTTPTSYKLSSTEADIEVMRITRGLDLNTNPDERPRINLKHEDTLPSVSDLIESSRHSSSKDSSTNVTTTEVCTINSGKLIKKQKERPQKESGDLPNFLKLFLRPEDKIEEFVPNTALLNALLAPSGLVIKPLVEKVNVSLNTSFDKDNAISYCNTSHISDPSDKVPSSASQDTATESPSVSWNLSAGRPPKLENLSKPEPVLHKSVGSSTDSPTKKSSSTNTSVVSISRSDLSERCRKPRIILNNEKPRRKEEEKPKDPSIEIYNIPKSTKPTSILSFDTWTCTDPPPKREHICTETTIVQTEERALSPIMVVEGEYPDLEKLEPVMPDKTSQPPGGTKTTTKTTRSKQGSPRSGYNPIHIPKLSSRPDDKKRLGPSSESNSDDDHDKDHELNKKDDGVSSSESEADTNTSATDSHGIEVKVKGKPSAEKEKLKDDLYKALMEVMYNKPHIKREIHPETLKGLKVQIERQTGDLVNARENLYIAGQKIRGMAQMFSMSRPSESPLEDNM